MVNHKMCGYKKGKDSYEYYLFLLKMNILKGRKLCFVCFFNYHFFCDFVYSCLVKKVGENLTKHVDKSIIY